MKKKLLVLLAVLFGLCFLSHAGLGNRPAHLPTKTPQQRTLNIVTHGGDDPYWAVVRQGMLDACKELGIKADMDFCGGDLALQLKR